MENIINLFQMPLPIKDVDWWNGKPNDFSNLPQWNCHWTQSFGSHPEWYLKYGLAGHNGLDIAYKALTPVVLPAKCYVTYTGNDVGYGNYVRVQTETIDGTYLELVFAHFSEIKIESGKWYDEGTLIGLGGSTGNSTGNHLHFGIRIHEVLPNGNTQIKDYNNGYFGYVDPEPYLPKCRWTFGELEQLKNNNMRYVIVDKEQYLLDDNLMIAFNIPNIKELEELNKKGLDGQPEPIDNIDGYRDYSMNEKDSLRDMFGL